MTVYVTQIPMRRDISSGALEPAIVLDGIKKYGDPVVLIPHEYRNASPKESIALLREKLFHFDPDIDYLLPLGTPYRMAAAGAILRDLFPDDDLNLLVWMSPHYQVLTMKGTT
jgi:hypothetical protein